MLTSLLLTAGVIYIPALSALLSFTPVAGEEYFIALGLAVAVIAAVEIVKFPVGLHSNFGVLWKSKSRV